MKSLLNKILHEKNIQSIFTNGSVAAINLLSFLILVRMLNTQEYGIWVIVISASTMLDMLRFGFTRTALTHYISSGSEDQIRKHKGSGFAIDLSGGAILFFVMIILFPFLKGVDMDAFSYLLIYYPFLAIANAPWNNALSILQAQQKFDLILVLKLSVFGLFLISILGINYLFVPNFKNVMIAFILANLIASFIAIVFKWTGAQSLKYITKNSIGKLIHYGKYTVLTNVGSSLLKSADTLIIGLMPVMGATAAAIYAIPLKVIELIQIPINGFVATAIPKLSKAFLENKFAVFLKTLYTYTGAVLFSLVPVIILLFIFSKQILLLLSGDQYVQYLPTMMPVMYLFLIYGLLLPIDRFTGVALDSAELPQLNAIKVQIMLALNIIGDLVAVFLFESLIMVAFVTLLFTLVGIFIGWHFLITKFKFEPNQIIKEGIKFYSRNVNMEALKKLIVK